mmetsp:Transcript_13481/g.26888  ORF Transcript_13481/g.26888 Transcript_13481/m.26888 type:complete len:229 (+) Transcript_13481:82-768(+)|eukprot:CAMPEP_0194323960 /NCGR_PEP_ID=MMETSP0171-20130528/26068_1 /TAXON_ID=218684 /ORGANISM="Corethron pennatum, Strain L29A3" /LENGTH=228 /DNA_ID=CAMNT_0039082723 /DNA_START=29 /DNA_END=715 /DNA_ORIENTATION=-
MTPIASFRLSPLCGTILTISSGSIVDYLPPLLPAAIVNAANEVCLGGGGVDGAISEAGGDDLYEDRFSLPTNDGITDGLIRRCHTGSAVITGPAPENGTYGDLGVNYVIHAVGPDYSYVIDGNEKLLTECDKLLYGAYKSSMERARDHDLKYLAFSLISAGIFKGRYRSLTDVLRIGLKAITDFGKDCHKELKEVTMCAFMTNELEDLIKIAEDLGLERVVDKRVDEL